MSETLSMSMPMPTTRGTGAPMLTQPVPRDKAWQAQDLVRAQWFVALPPEALAELDAVVRTLRSRSYEAEALDPADFELMHCRALMAGVRQQLDDGSGFSVLDKLPPHYSDEELTALYWLLSSLLARPVAQNVRGARLYKVHDTGKKPLPGSGVRPDQTNMEQNFHNDNSYNLLQPDYIGLLCVRPAVEGGESSIISLATVHNQLLEESPDLLQRLYQPFWVDRQKEHEEGDSPVLFEPIFSYDGKLRVRMGLHPILNGYAMQGVPIDERGLDAMAKLREIFRRPELCFAFTMERGQMQFVDNLGICHRRTAFIDSQDPAQKRLLMRIWLRDGGAGAYNG